MYLRLEKSRYGRFTNLLHDTGDGLYEVLRKLHSSGYFNVQHCLQVVLQVHRF